MSSGIRPSKADLRAHLRDEQLPSDSVVVIRGGPSSLAKLAAHARRTHDAYQLDGMPLWGVEQLSRPVDERS
jgi:hypothetical protein